MMMSYKKLRRLLIEQEFKEIIYDIKLNEQNKIMNTINDFSKIS